MRNGTTGNSPKKPSILMLEWHSTSWWYWLMTVVCLTAGLCGWTQGFGLALGITAFQLARPSIRGRGIRAFPVQVRLGYLLLLLIAVRFRCIYWIPTIGTWALVLFGYCAMARTVSLMPWNRKLPLTCRF